MKYDDASWHSGGDFPQNSPQEYGGTHIALFMKWCFIKGWAGEIHHEQSADDLQKVIQGTMPATEYFFKYCDGQLTDEDLNDEGNVFASQYYGDDGLYFEDYAKHFGDLMYVESEGKHDFNKYSSVLDARLRNGILVKSHSKPWWKFW